MFDAVIFDVDGTLWDATARAAESWQATCERLGVPAHHITQERLMKEFGKTLEDIGYSLFPDLPKKESVRILDQCCTDELDYLRANHPDFYPEIREVLSSLASRLPVFIVSNCQAGYIEAMMETAGIEAIITDHLCPGDTGEAKAANLLRLAEKYDLKNAAYVGDTMGDYNAVREAGMYFIFASYGYGSVPEPDAVIDCPRALLDHPEIPE